MISDITASPAAPAGPGQSSSENRAPQVNRAWHAGKSARRLCEASALRTSRRAASAPNRSVREDAADNAGLATTQPSRRNGSVGPRCA